MRRGALQAREKSREELRPASGKPELPWARASSAHSGVLELAQAGRRMELAPCGAELFRRERRAEKSSAPHPASRSCRGREQAARTPVCLSLLKPRGGWSSLHAARSSSGAREEPRRAPPRIRQAGAAVGASKQRALRCA